jgi:hypothetical protein
MQKRLQILATAAPMTMLAWAVRIEHPVIAMVAWGCIALLVILALFQKDEPNSVAGLKRRAKKLAKLARTLTPEDFDGYRPAVGAVRLNAENLVGIIRTTVWADRPVKTHEELEGIARNLDELVKQLDQL